MTIEAVYIWLDIKNNVRSKTRYIPMTPSELGRINGSYYSSYDNVSKIFPDWDYDGSSCGIASTEDSEIILKPFRYFIVNHVFNKPHYLDKKECVRCIVMCESYTKKEPALSNYRDNAVKVFNSKKDSKPWFGFELEFYMLSRDKRLVVEQSDNYCSVGAGKAYQRDFIETVINKCFLLGMNITGYNFEVGPGQAEIQLLGEGIEACDNLFLLKYVLLRVSEDFDVDLSFHPKPFPKLNGSGCHINFSTEETRGENGLDAIYRYISNLEKTHIDAVDKSYGDMNSMRLTGKHETSSIDRFTFGVGDRTASIRIPNRVIDAKSGYFEDRRPASNINPYLATMFLMEAAQ